MKYAKSIYRGGFIADADACDYSSSRTLGLTCPFCNEAVFWRQGSKSVRAAKPIVIRPSFCHYGSSAEEGKACELRSVRREGQEYVQRLATEAKNQRLKLYNDRLWQIFVANIERDDVELKGSCKFICRYVAKTLGKHWAHNKARETQQVLAANIDFWQRDLEQTFKNQMEQVREQRGFTNAKVERVLSKLMTEAQHAERLAELSEFDEQMQILICHEILDFLITPTGFRAFERLFYWHLWTLGAIMWLRQFETEAPPDALKVFARKIKDLDQESHVMGIPLSIIKVNWVKFSY